MCPPTEHAARAPFRFRRWLRIRPLALFPFSRPLYGSIIAHLCSMEGHRDGKKGTGTMNIDDLRKKIDAYDHEIIRLLNERAEAATAIGKSKRERGLPFYDAGPPEDDPRPPLPREQGIFPETGLRHVFTEIMSACLNLESLLTIGFMGPEATFTHMAAKEVFGSSAEYIPYQTTRDTFRACEKGWTTYGVAPIENSSAGVVHDTLDCFGDTRSSSAPRSPSRSTTR